MYGHMVIKLKVESTEIRRGSPGLQPQWRDIVAALVLRPSCAFRMTTCPLAWFKELEIAC